MGAGRVAMPLLSTLAALVIIVHSAEEGQERGYRYELRPRSLDTGTPNYDPPWRAIESAPIMQQSKNSDIWQESPDMPRRRPVRKRKRRPQPPSSEDLIPQERYLYVEEKPYETDPQTTEMPRRRRKKPETRRHRWTEEFLETERPLRRRSQRRKRPSLETWPELSEFNLYKSEEKPTVKPEQHEPLDADDNANDNAREQFDKTEIDNGEIDIQVQTEAINPINRGPLEIEEDLHLKEDKSLSEFSMEDIKSHLSVKTHDELTDLQAKIGEKAPILNVIDKARNKNGPIDPMTLKEILKRSNGTSLSEILQQHNLSLSDLLHGKQNAISALKPEEILENKNDNSALDKETFEKNNTESTLDDTAMEENETSTEPIIEGNEDTVSNNKNETRTSINDYLEPQTEVKQSNIREILEDKDTSAPKIATKRRFPGIRRKLRLRPLVNATYKGQLNRDLIALTARKYLNHRNVSKSKEWKNVISSMRNITNQIDENKKEISEILPTTTSLPEETTILHNFEYYNPTTLTIDLPTNINENKDEEEDITTTEPTKHPTTTIEPTTTEVVSTTEKPKISRNIRPQANRMGLRRQAFNNRLKRKRLKQKNSTTEPPKDDVMKDLFGIPNLVSSSEFIARTQSPKPTTTQIHEEYFTSLDDFLTTEKSKRVDHVARPIRNSTTVSSTTAKVETTTEETAKFEIEEILNDTRTSAKLSRILMERNMTLSELVDHRERGSSHVHLADIFHNASKEPNPPEPFLSKSFIEPISKETYPLRALLDANLHDPMAKATTIDPNPTQTQYVPVVMDFGNNVNENGENMGIMSLFNKLTENDISIEKSDLKKDSEGTPYVTTVITSRVNTTSMNDTTRESRVLKDDEDNLDHDIANWNELFSLMRSNHKNDTEDELESLTKDVDIHSRKKIILEEDKDGDGLIVLEDLQHLKDYDSHIASASEEKLEVNAYERADNPTQKSHSVPKLVKPGILDPLPSNTRSVTVATASIIGLALVLFLLTYAVFKWNQQRKLLRKKQSFCDERIPTPVFENRKSNKNNCSTRSISPMLASSNIYTMNTLDSHNGKESPDYMWDSLRKPFQ